MEQEINKTKVYNVIIMDRSGSMWEIQKSAIMGYNEVLGGVKAAVKKFAKTQDQYMTLVLFDGSSVDEVYWNADPETVPILNDRTYVPGSSTPLYDAVGRTLTKLEKELKDDDNHSVAVTIITDGYENDSREYSLEAVSSMIDHLKKEGWSFAYMGTDHDVHSVTASLCITNVVKFEKSEEATKASFLKESQARTRWMTRMDEFIQATPGATAEARIAFNAKSSSEWYSEENADKKTSKKTSKKTGK